MNAAYRTMDATSRRGILFLILGLFFSSPSWAQAPDASSSKTDPDKTITNSIGMKLVLIPAGEFMMGKSHTIEEEIELERRYGLNLPTDVFNDILKCSYPQHRVRITKPFYLAAYEVTVGQFRKFVEDTGYKTDAEKHRWPWVKGASQCTWQNPGPGFEDYNHPKLSKDTYPRFEQTDDHPVVNVSWKDANAFCKWLSDKERKTYRLPTEAEWEYACRAGTTTRYYSGDDPETLAKVGNVADATAKEKFPDWNTISASDGYAFTAPVGKSKPNDFGLYDMHGNAFEWCMDWFRENYYSVSPTDDPKGPKSGRFGHVHRGDDWAGPMPPIIGSAGRSSGPDPDLTPMHGSILGFRVARDQ